MTNRIELSLTERFFFDGGHEFGSAGTYQRLIGRAHFAVEPGASAQRCITDIDDPREARLTRRRYPYDERVPVPAESWCFARIEGESASTTRVSSRQ